LLILQEFSLVWQAYLPLHWELSMVIKDKSYDLLANGVAHYTSVD
jgi:hypothetical protein